MSADGAEATDAAADATVRSVNGPITFSGIAASAPGPVPTLGEHTAEVLAELTD